MAMRRFLALICVLFFFASGLSAQTTVFKYVKIRRHRSEEKRVLVDKYGTLTFDDSARKLLFQSEAGDHIEVAYDDVAKAVFESTTHMRGGVLAQVVQAAPLAGPMVGTAMAGAHISNYWFYFEYRDHERDES